jgi:hypothetical protein
MVKEKERNQAIMEDQSKKIKLEILKNQIQPHFSSIPYKQIYAFII